jgi:hypothetical protein
MVPTAISVIRGEISGSGLLVPSDAHAFTETIVPLCEQPESARLMESRGRDRGRDCFPRAACARAQAGIYCRFRPTNK